MIEDVFELFNGVLGGLPGEEWFVCVMAAAVIFGIGCLIKMICVKE